MGFSPASPPRAAAPRWRTVAATGANASRRYNQLRAMPAPAPDAGRLRFGRPSRLAQSRDFMRVRQTGQRLAFGCLIANWSRLPEGSASRLGVVTSKKIGGAVQRARARRLLRETFRQHQHEFAQPVELVLVARNSIAGRSFAEVEKDFLAALKRAGLRKMTKD